MRSALALVALAGCTTTPQPPDFLTADSADQRVTAIQLLPDDRVQARLDDLGKAASDQAPRVRDQVALRLGRWGDPAGLPILRRMYRDDPHHEVSRAALAALRDVCFTHHGALRPDRPPAGPIPDDCTPAYDGTWLLPPHRPPPRQEAAAFWSSHQVTTKTLPSGETWPVDEADRARVFHQFPEPRGPGAGRP